VQKKVPVEKKQRIKVPARTFSLSNLSLTVISRGTQRNHVFFELAARKNALGKITYNKINSP
jgi:hypothetical protein